MSGRRFRYALESVLRRREWRVDELRRELAEQNEQLERQEAMLRGLDDRAQAALAEWRAQCGDGQLLHPARSAMYGAYLEHLRRESAREAATLASLRAGRDELIDTLAGAIREHDAVQRHKDEQQRQFRRDQNVALGKEIEDHWITLWNRRANANPT